MSHGNTTLPGNTRTFKFKLNAFQQKGNYLHHCTVST